MNIKKDCALTVKKDRKITLFSDLKNVLVFRFVLFVQIITKAYINTLQNHQIENKSYFQNILHS